MAIEKAPSKNWELTLYEMQRKPQPLITDDSEIAICPLRLSNELKCPICLDFLSNTMATKECLHRFCSQCIVTALRSGNKECPACRKKLVSKRSLRRDVNFDAIIAKLFPYRKEYEAHQANVMAKQIKNSTRTSKINGSDRQVDKTVDNIEPPENVNNNSSSNNETESGSSKDQSSTTSVYQTKYRNNVKYNERNSLAIQSDNNSSMQVDEELSVTASSEIVLPQIRVRHPSSESGGRETNCSSSITSELCSLIGNQSRENITQPCNISNDKILTNSLAENNIDVVLEPLDGRTGKNKLNETFAILIPDVATVGHLIEFLHIKRMDIQKAKRTNFDSEISGKIFKALHTADDVTYNIYLGMTSNEKKSLNASQDPNRQSSSSMVRTARKSMNRKMETTDKLNQIISEYSLNKKKIKKDKKQKSMDSSEFLVFYYHETPLKNSGNLSEMMN